MSDSIPKIEWPAGHRAALSVIVHVPGTGMTDENGSQSNLIGQDYTVTGLTRMLESFADLDVLATVAFSGEAAQTAPELIRRTQELGHEVAATACSTTGSTEDLLEAIANVVDDRANGLVEQLPGFQASEQEEPFGNDSGRAWRITGSGGDLPILERDPDSVIIPVSPYLIDTAWLSPTHPLPPSSLLETWSLALASHRTDGTFMPIVVHPHIMGRPGFMGTLTRFLDEVIAAGDVWIARLDHVATMWNVYQQKIEE
jgi:peptidoglycan/xylan/chitin deacetylase (PgdA/CDA1 family)